MTPPTTISRALAEYLTDWLAWVDRGAPDGEPYDRARGLCANTPLGSIFRDLRRLFAGNNYPFGGRDEYWLREFQKAQHLNEARLAWVRSTLATAEIEG